MGHWGDEKHTYNEHFYKDTSEDKYTKKKVQLISRKCLKSLSYFFFKKLIIIKTQIFNIIKFYSKKIYTEWNDASFNPKEN